MLSKTESRFMLQLKLQGFLSKNGNMTKDQRKDVLLSLTKKGLLDENCRLTEKGETELAKNQNIDQ